MSDDERQTPPSPVRTRATGDDADTGGWLALLRQSKAFHLFLERGLWPLLTLLAGGAFAHLKTTAKVDEKAAEVTQETESAVRLRWKSLAEDVNKLGPVIKAMDDRLAAIEKTQKAQSAVIVAQDFVVEGRPAPRRRIDPGLVRAVKENAAKNATELAARVRRPAPIIKPIPLEPPPLPPKNQDAAPPPPVPTPKPPEVVPVATPTVQPAPQNPGGASGK